MNEQLVDALIILEDAAYIRRERLNGDPDREPDETTEEDVIEAMIRRRSPDLEIVRRKDPYTHALRIMLKGIIDPKG